jgi:hypothetical protein
MAAGEDMALVEEGMPVHQPQFLDEVGAHRLAVESEAGHGLVALSLRPEMRPARVRRPAVARRIVGRGVAEGRAEEIAGQAAEMRRGVLRHLLAEPRHLVQHRDLQPVALDDQLGNHSEQRLDTDLDALCFDLDMCHRRVILRLRFRFLDRSVS